MNDQCMNTTKRNTFKILLIESIINKLGISYNSKEIRKVVELALLTILKDEDKKNIRIFARESYKKYIKTKQTKNNIGIN